MTTTPMPRRDAIAASGFLAGGGEMGALMRSLDWAATPLGPVAGWPQSLRTAVGILLNSRHPMFIAWGGELAFLYNDGYIPVFGAKHPAALGRPFAEVWADIWSDIAPLVERALAGEATWSDDLRLFMIRSGYLEESYFTFSYSPIRSEAGGIGGMFCACIETTGKVLSERRLRCLRDIAAVGAEAKTVEDAQARSLAALGTEDVPFALLYRQQPGGFALAGAVNAEPGGGGAPALLEGTDDLWPVARAAREGIQLVDDLASRLDSPPRSPWGDPVGSALVVPMTDRGHAEPTGAMVLGINTRRALDDDYRSFLTLVAGGVATAAANARAFEDERRRSQALAELDRAKTTFFANVSHEFRTPLTLILSPLEDLLAEQHLPSNQRHRLAMAHRNSLRLLKMVNALLDFSRIEAGRMQASYVATDLAAFTTDLASNFHSACQRAGIALLVDCPPLPEAAYVDREMWEKIVLNLVSNAFKFTLSGEISVTLSSCAGTARLAVRDTGVGIPASQIDKVFERFSRVEGTSGRSHEGTGIGLALVQELVKLHGGDIRVDSTPGQGTTFTVSIPLGFGHLPADHVGAARPYATSSIDAFVGEALQWSADAGGTAADAAPAPGAAEVQAGLPNTAYADPEGEPSRILWVDDNADMRSYVTRLLGGRYLVRAVDNGEDALAEALADPPDLVLSDIMLPRLDGLGLLRRLRAEERTREVPVILLSARAGEDATVAGLRAGADDYLVKPFSARELLARVEAQLNMQKIRREAASALRESEARFRNLADNAPVMVWVTEPDGRCTFLSQSWYEYTGQTPEAALGLGWIDAAHPDDRAEVRRAFLAANAVRGTFSIEYRLRRHDGAYRWALDSASPRLGDAGEFLGYIGSVIDIDERKRAEQHRILLVDELNHRVKNTLAVVHGLARQTFRSPGIPTELRRSFEGRLGALSAAHNLLTETNWRNASLVGLARSIVAATCGDTRQVDIGGPDLALSPRAAVTMTMALNELCTNAAKHGALSTAGGRVALHWEVAGEPAVLKLTWRESEGPDVRPPTARGFGTRIIEQALAQELDGRVTMEFRPCGLVVEFEAPLPTVRDDFDERAFGTADPAGRG